MDEQTKKFYETLIDMFMSEGWKNLMEEYRTLALILNSVEDTKDANDLFFKKGQLDIIARILNTESTVDHVMEGSNEGL